MIWDVQDEDKKDEKQPNLVIKVNLPEWVRWQSS